MLIDISLQSDVINIGGTFVVAALSTARQAREVRKPLG
jgi:hypothetical protein